MKQELPADKAVYGFLPAVALKQGGGGLSVKLISSNLSSNSQRVLNQEHTVWVMAQDCRSSLLLS